MNFGNKISEWTISIVNKREIKLVNALKLFFLTVHWNRSRPQSIKAIIRKQKNDENDG